METIRQLGNGTRILHSTYPWIDETSENYDAFATRQLLALEASTGLPSKRSPAPGGALVDPFLPQARALVWEKVKTGYFDSGIEMFWLDDTEPNIRTVSVRSVATRSEGVRQLYELLQFISLQKIFYKTCICA